MASFSQQAVNSYQDEVGMKSSLSKISCAMFLSILSLQGVCGTLLNVSFETDVQLFQSKGEITGCGLGFVGIEDGSKFSQQVRLVSGSIALFSSGAGLTKVVMTTLKYDPSRKQQSDAPLSKVTDFWMRRTGGKIITSANKKLIPSADNKDALLQVISSNDFADLFKAINSDDEFQVGVSAKNEKNELIFAGKLKVSDKDIKRLEDCMTSLFEAK